MFLVPLFGSKFLATKFTRFAVQELQIGGAPCYLHRA